MDKEKISVAQMDGVCKAGCIISIVSSGIVVLMALIWGILWLTLDLKITDNNLTPDQIEYLRIFRRVSGGMLIFLGLIQILPLFFSINLLRGKASSNIPAGVIALIFSGLIGGILILVGKYQVGTVTTSVKENQPNKPENEG